MARGFSRQFSVCLVICLLVNAFCAPAPQRTKNRPSRDDVDDDENKIGDGQKQPTTSSTTKDPFDDNDDDFGTPIQTTSSGGGSNIFSLLNLATALFPSSSGSSSSKALRDMIKRYLIPYQEQVAMRRRDFTDNVIDIDYKTDLTPPFLRQEDVSDHESEENDEDDDDDDDDSESDSESEEQNDAAEESIENGKDEVEDKASKQDSNGSNGGNDDDNDSDYSDEPEGDGQGGGILGLLAGLSGGEDGSDLGTLLATVSQIVGNLSGDGFDLNALLASAFGLFVGLLSEGEENPGAVIASYLLTSLDTITGGGAKNNGAYFGSFLSKLVKGISAAEGGSGESSEENGNGEKMADSAGFFASLLMSLSGDMSKGSSGGSSHPWRRHFQQ